MDSRLVPADEGRRREREREREAGGRRGASQRELNLSGRAAHAGERGGGRRREIKKEIVSSRCFKLPFITTHKPKEPRRSSLARKERKVLGLYSSAAIFARPRTPTPRHIYTLFYIIESHLRYFFPSFFSLHFLPFLLSPFPRSFSRSPHSRPRRTVASSPAERARGYGCRSARYLARPEEERERGGDDLGNDHYLRYSDK